MAGFSRRAVTYFVIVLFLFYLFIFRPKIKISFVTLLPNLSRISAGSVFISAAELGSGWSRLDVANQPSIGTRFANAHPYFIVVV